MILGIDLEAFYNTYIDEISKSIGIIVVTILLIYLLKRLTKKYSNKIFGEHVIHNIVFKILKVFIYGISIVLLINIWGISMSPILASFGVVGVALSLGAQKVIQDLLAGVFIHAEHQFKVKDVIEVKGFKGKVIHLGPRITQIQNWKGEVMIIANGQIEQMINYSTAYATAVVDFPVSYQDSYEKVEKLINKFFDSFHSNVILERPELSGVNDFDEYSYYVKVFCKVKPGEQFQVERDIKTGIMKIFEDNGIRMPKSKLGI